MSRVAAVRTAASVVVATIDGSSEGMVVFAFTEEAEGGAGERRGTGTGGRTGERAGVDAGAGEEDGAGVDEELAGVTEDKGWARGICGERPPPACLRSKLSLDSVSLTTSTCVLLRVIEIFS